MRSVIINGEFSIQPQVAELKSSIIPLDRVSYRIFCKGVETSWSFILNVSTFIY